MYSRVDRHVELQTMLLFVRKIQLKVLNNLLDVIARQDVLKLLPLPQMFELHIAEIVGLHQLEPQVVALILKAAWPIKSDSDVLQISIHHFYPYIKGYHIFQELYMTHVIQQVASLNHKIHSNKPQQEFQVELNSQT